MQTVTEVMVAFKDVETELQPATMQKPVRNSKDKGMEGWY